MPVCCGPIMKQKGGHTCSTSASTSTSTSASASSTSSCCTACLFQPTPVQKEMGYLLCTSSCCTACSFQPTPAEKEMGYLLWRCCRDGQEICGHGRCYSMQLNIHLAPVSTEGPPFFSKWPEVL